MLTMEKPSWAEGLRPCGTDFEGFVDDATTKVEKCKADALLLLAHEYQGWLRVTVQNPLTKKFTKL